jgi:hypothetical protein
MQALLIGGLALLLLIAIVMTVIALKVLRENRARSVARVAALQALVNTEFRTTEVTGETEVAEETEFAEMETPAFMRRPVRQPEGFDLALRQDQDPVPQPRFVRVEVPLPEPRFAHVEPQTPLFEDTAPRTPGHRFAWMAATALVMASLVGAFFLISSGVIGRVMASNAARARAASNSTTPIELLSLRHAIDATGAFTVTGLVQNPAASVPLQGVTAVVYLFDAEGKYFASSRAALESTVLSPGGQAGFTVRVPSPSSPSSLPSPSISQYRVSFQQNDGAAVIHVDRRGALPEQTTGDTVQTAPVTTPLVAARKIS